MVTLNKFRLTYWSGQHECKSKISRHYMCMFAVEHLEELQTSPNLYANKFMPNEDYGAISCWFEYLHNRTHVGRDISWLNEQLYLNRPQVCFNDRVFVLHSFT